MIAASRAHRLFGQRRARVRVLPFAAAFAVAFALVPLDRTGPDPAYELWLALGLAAAIVAALAAVPWRRLPLAAGLLPLAAFFAVTALLRDSLGGAASGYAPLVILPVLWAGAFGRWRDIAVVTAGALLTLGLPPLVGGDPEYPAGELRRALLATAVGAIGGVGIAVILRTLHAEIARRTAAERALERMTADELHDDIVQMIVAAQLALALDDRRTADGALARALDAAQHVVSKLLRASGADGSSPGRHRRRRPPPPADPQPPLTGASTRS